MTILHLIPVGLGDSAPERWLPQTAREIAAQLRFFIAENAKSARAFLKLIGTAVPLQEITIHTLRADTTAQEIRDWLAAVPTDQDLGLVSEAGCPAVADPGALVVAQAQARGLRVQPWTGPSSIMLGLMASGLQGQRFAFHGYAPVKAHERDAQLRAWESLSHKHQQTQILIETPYRNLALFEALLSVLRESTRLCVASSLTCKEESVRTLSIQEWRKAGAPDFERQPTLFLFLAG
ncbi:SAM-dependent methyltransferase [Castellaniella sp.]|uniref:SAM-dependent methyltransferase n=1 Tax=Castellaniella sp. TaxID=1955812 RepID=UPI002AFF6A31|nr:SAM-dependent methyltransferase [Castellaniella sp.]